MKWSLPWGALVVASLLGLARGAAAEAGGGSPGSEAAQPDDVGEGSGEEADPEGGAEEDDPNRFEWAPFPALGGDTDIGFKFGVDMAVARLAPGFRPYRYRLRINAALSVKSAPDGGTDWPEHDYAVGVDFPGLLGGRLRVIAEAGFSRIVNAGYYGLSGLSSDDPLGRYALSEMWGGRRYQFLRQMPKADLDLRWRPGAAPIEVLFGAHFRYLFPRPYANSQAARDAARTYEDGSPILFGFEDHALAMLRAGLLWDRRDHEIVPSSGTYLAVAMRGGVGFPRGGFFAFGGATIDFRFFLPLLSENRVTLAGRLMADLLLGDAPFYELTRMGTFTRIGYCSGEAVAGCPEGRYAGQLKVIGALELRTLFARFRLFGIPMVFGMLVNATVGQSWATLDPRPPFRDAGPSATWSVGYALNLRWGEAVMVRIEVAYSPDATDGGLPVGIYFGLGYAF